MRQEFQAQVHYFSMEENHKNDRHIRQTFYSNVYELTKLQVKETENMPKEPNKQNFKGWKMR